nr:peptidoglycan editing factor PgeF [Betaproteobacteria bacterium]
GGVSGDINGLFATLNIADHVNDDPVAVARNRDLLRVHLPQMPKWLKQVHGTLPVWVENITTLPEGDAALSCQRRTVCAVMVADCLPVFLCDKAGKTVGIVHAGWRGLAGGIIEQSVAEMRKAQLNNSEFMAWLGPAIGSKHFEIGEEVYASFVKHDEMAAEAFILKGDLDKKKWLADIFVLARQRLAAVGITKVYGGGICTYSDPTRFYSYRRDGETGRMGALIWLE